MFVAVVLRRINFSNFSRLQESNTFNGVQVTIAIQISKLKRAHIFLKTWNA